jgi:glycosyltransferase involved in cell wall biosynthesis
LIRYLQATDIYLIPYINKDQISSGTLVYALSTGKAVISTPFLHAKEVISEGCAMECKFKDPESINQSIKTLLNNEEVRKNFEEKAYEYSRNMIWPKIAMEHINLFYKALGI